MPIKVEQITDSGLVVDDFDVKINPQGIKNILLKLPKLNINTNKNPFEANYKNKNIKLCVKNISYLGIPHLHYKKRIQIPKEWRQILQDENTLLLGVYSYNNAKTFCLFNTSNYKKNNLNNSSAHIYTIDIHKARELGIFKKTDKNNNNLIVFTEENFEKVFDEVLLNIRVNLSNEIDVFNQFSNTLQTSWHGIDCYREMINGKFNNAYQPEWAGFYLEYKFNEFLNSNPQYKEYCQYIQNKSNNSIDLDLWFEEKRFFGDLKAHTIGTDLLGNDKATVQDAINNYGKIWYIAFSHYTEKDQNHDGIVTNFWNIELNKRQQKTSKGKIKKLNSYISRMKNSVELNNFTVLEVNKFNAKYLSDFQQGKNSNNQSRSTKISIKAINLKNDNFVIYRQKL